MKSLNILITSAGGNGAGNQIAKCLRLIKNSKYNLYYADNNPDNIQFRHNEIFTLPLVSNKDYTECLLKIVKKNKIDVIFPGSDKELIFFAKNINFFKERELFIPINNLKTINLCLDKSALNDQLYKLGYTPPKSIKFSLNEKIPNIDWYPLVLKPSGEGGGSANVFIAQNHDELKYLIKYLSRAFYHSSFILQEYIGSVDSEFTVGILHDLLGEFIDSIALNRDLSQSISVRSSVPNTTRKDNLGTMLTISSGVSQGIIGKFPDITAQCKEIAESIGSTGPLNIQCRVVDGIVRVFEINPRYSGTSFFRSLAGFNEPTLLIERHIFNKPIQKNIMWPNFKAVRSLNENIFVPK